MTTIQLRPESGRNFGKGVRNAKSLGARFDGTRKVWTISLDAWKAANATQRGYLNTVVNRQHEPNCAAYYGAGPCECRS